MLMNKRIFSEAMDLDLTQEKYYELYYTIQEETGIDDIIGIFQVDKESFLYQALQAWYKYKDIDPVDYENSDYAYFIHGANYAIYDELVGGNGSTETQKEFLDYINSID